MTEFKSVIVVQTNESGQPTNLLSLEDGDTISNEVLNNDVRNAASGFSTLETSVVSLNTSTEDISGSLPMLFINLKLIFFLYFYT
jgi:hypothetical protein